MAQSHEDRSDFLPSLPVSERDRRWGEVRERMSMRGIDCMLVWASDHYYGAARANLRYLTQVPGQIDAIGLFPRIGDPVVWVDIPHLREPYDIYQLYQDWTDDIRLLEGIKPIVDEINSRDYESGNIGVVGYQSALVGIDVPYGDYNALKRRLPNVTFTDTTDIVDRARLIKSDEEIKFLREACRISGKMAEALMDAEPGMNECEVYADMVHAQISNGGEAYIFNFFDSGSPTTDEYAHLQHGKGQPLSPTTRTLEKGDIINTEYHTDYGGYLASTQMSVALSQAPDELKDIHEVALQCQDAAMKAFKPGARLQDIWETIRAPVHEAGMDFLELGFHGHGLSSPEFPSVVYPQGSNAVYGDEIVNHPMAGKGLEEVRVKEGMVFGTNIDIHNPDWRDDVGLQFGDTVLITESGSEALVNTPRDFVV